jgi:hypothetical protein
MLVINFVVMKPLLPFSIHVVVFVLVLVLLMLMTVPLLVFWVSCSW